MKEGRGESKAERACWTYTRDLFRLASLTFALSNYTQTLAHTLTDPFTICPPLCAAMEVLVSELGVLLKMLDQENLSSTTQEKKTSVRNLLQQIEPSGNREEGNSFLH